MTNSDKKGVLVIIMFVLGLYGTYNLIFTDARIDGSVAIPFLFMVSAIDYIRELNIKELEEKIKDLTDDE